MRTTPIAGLGLLLLSLAAACGGGGETDFSGSGSELFQNQCAMCHARDGSGSALAPTLLGKKGNWTHDSLVAYLKDPAGFAAKDPRLKSQGSKFSQAMPTYKMLPPEALDALADHVLALP